MLIAQTVTEAPSDLPWWVLTIIIPLVISISGSLVTVIGTLFVGKQLGIFNYQLTTTQNQATKESERVGELENMATVQQIEQIVNNAVGGLKTDIETQVNGLGQRIDRAETNLGNRIDSLATEVRANTTSIAVVKNTLDERLPKQTYQPN